MNENSPGTSQVARDDQLRKTARLRFLITGIAALIATRLIAHAVFPVYDDAFITYRYAENLADGLGFVYHQGDWVLGVTTPLFGLLCSLFSFISSDIPQFVVYFNIACDVLILALVTNYLLRDLSSAATHTFTVLFILSPLLNRICVGGMEMSLFVLCSVAGIILYVNNRKDLALALTAMCIFLRPEGVVLLAVLSAFSLREVGLLKTMKTLITASFVLGVGLTLEWIYYHSIIPQSVSAKAHYAHPGVFMVLKSLLFAEPLTALTSLALIPALMRFRRLTQVLQIFVAWTVLYVTAYLIGRPQIWSWYSAAIAVSLIIISALVIAEFSVKRMSLQTIFDWFVKKYLVAPLAVIAVWMVIYFEKGPDLVQRDVYQPLSEWCGTKDLRGKSIMAGDIGAIGYYSKSRIYDPEGLVWKEARNYSSYDSLILDTRADFLFLNYNRKSFELVERLSGRADYRRQKCFVRHDRDTVSGPSQADTLWSQDYILYELSKE